LKTCEYLLFQKKNHLIVLLVTLALAVLVVLVLSLLLLQLTSNLVDDVRAYLLQGPDIHLENRGCNIDGRSRGRRGTATHAAGLESLIDRLLRHDFEHDSLQKAKLPLLEGGGGEISHALAMLPSLRFFPKSIKGSNNLRHTNESKSFICKQINTLHPVMVYLPNYHWVEYFTPVSLVLLERQSI